MQPVHELTSGMPRITPLFGCSFVLGKTSRITAQNLSCRDRTDEFPLQDQWDLYVDQSGMTDVYAGTILLESDTQSLLIGALTASFPLGICVDGTTKAREVAFLSEMSPFPVDKDDSEIRSFQPVSFDLLKAPVVY